MTKPVHVSKADLEYRLRTTLAAVIPLLPAAADSEPPLDGGTGDDFGHGAVTHPVTIYSAPPTRRHLQYVRAAAAAALIAATGGALWATTGHSGNAPEAQRSAPPPLDTPSQPTTTALGAAIPVAFVFDAIPGGLRLGTRPVGPVVRTEPSSSIYNEYGSRPDPLDPAGMVHIEYGLSEAMTLACFTGEGEPGVAEVEAFELGSGQGRTCRVNGILTANWAIEPQGVKAAAMAGPGVTSDRLLQLVRSLTPEPIVPTATGQPPIRLAPTNLPDDWQGLVTEDAPVAQQISEANWVATPDGTDSDHTLLVSTWTGLDDDYGVLVRHSAIQAERVTVRGHDGYRYISPQRGDRGPLQIEIWWTEQPGVVVSVTGTDVAEPDELMAWIEQLRPVDAAGYAAFETK